MSSDAVNERIPVYRSNRYLSHHSSTHKTPTINRWLLAHLRFHPHFTPTHSSLFNLVECCFAELTSKWRKRGTDGFTLLSHGVAPWERLRRLSRED